MQEDGQTKNNFKIYKTIYKNDKNVNNNNNKRRRKKKKREEEQRKRKEKKKKKEVKKELTHVCGSGKTAKETVDHESSHKQLAFLPEERVLVQHTRDHGFQSAKLQTQHDSYMWCIQRKNIL